MSTTMTVSERATAISRANRAFRALQAHPETTPRELGAARDHLNDCHRLADPDAVWAAVADIEHCAADVYGAPDASEPAPRATGRWITPRGGSRTARPRRPRQPPRS